MGALFNRRRILIAIGALLATTPLRGQSRQAHRQLVTTRTDSEGLKVGPTPALPPLPERPYPYRGYYLFTDGHIAEGGGFVWQMRLRQLVLAGFARAIPYGLDIQTDAQKLWLLGRDTFAPLI